MRRRQERVWGTYCAACRTVRLRATRVVCEGSGRDQHALTVIEVLP